MIAKLCNIFFFSCFGELYLLENMRDLLHGTAFSVQPVSLKIVYRAYTYGVYICNLELEILDYNLQIAG